MPQALRELIDEFSGFGWADYAWSLGLVASAALLGAIAAALLLRVLTRWSRRTDTKLDDAVAKWVPGPLRWLMPLLGARAVLPVTHLPPGTAGFLTHATLIGVIGCAGWLAMRFVLVVQDVVVARYDLNSADNLEAREVVTQMRGFRNLAHFTLLVLTLAFALLTFDAVRQFGVTLLASAGIAGVVVGFAAQKSIATVIAGIQIALTQPIRVDDVVIVEGEWGRIEEIRLTYVVVRIWDLRRLVVPVTQFIDKPFQNWTRTSAEILGTVFVYADYTIPVDEVRAELERILDDSRDLWDGKVSGLQVTDTTDRHVELRALMSAADSSKAWDLRCRVRERLVTWIQKNHPASLPRFRAELDRELEAA